MPAVELEFRVIDTGNGQRPITCKHCGQVSPSLKEHAAHLLSAHREETLARCN